MKDQGNDFEIQIAACSDMPMKMEFRLIYIIAIKSVHAVITVIILNVMTVTLMKPNPVLPDGVNLHGKRTDVVR